MLFFFSNQVMFYILVIRLLICAQMVPEGIIESGSSHIYAALFYQVSDLHTKSQLFIMFNFTIEKL